MITPIPAVVTPGKL